MLILISHRFPYTSNVFTKGRCYGADNRGGGEDEKERVRGREKETKGEDS